MYGLLKTLEQGSNKVLSEANSGIEFPSILNKKPLEEVSFSLNSGHGLTGD
jgi:hypothetical protein